MFFADTRPIEQISLPTAADLGWRRLAGADIAGVPVYETYISLAQKIYATSHHGWEFTVLDDEEAVRLFLQNAAGASLKGGSDD